jgi:hypothetical protein
MPRRRRFVGGGFAWLPLAVTLSAAAMPAVPARTAAPAGQDARPKTAAGPAGEEGLFEFLGGIGSEDAQWIDYLSNIDPAKVAPPHSGAIGRGDRSEKPAGRSDKN